MRARDRPDARARSLLRVVPVDFRQFSLNGTNRHELVSEILYPKFVCLNTKFLDIIGDRSRNSGLVYLRGLAQMWVPTWGASRVDVGADVRPLSFSF